MFYLKSKNAMMSSASVNAEDFQGAFQKFKENYSGIWNIVREDDVSVEVNLDAPYQKRFVFEGEVIETWVKGK